MNHAEHNIINEPARSDFPTLLLSSLTRDTPDVNGAAQECNAIIESSGVD